MQLTLCRVGVAEEDKMLPTANLCAGITTGDDAHTFDALGNTHLRVQDGAVGGEVHATDVIGGERGVLQLYPCFTTAVFVHDAGGVIGQHLVDPDVLGSLSKHPRGTEQRTAEQ